MARIEKGGEAAMKGELIEFFKWTLNSSVSKADEKPKDYCISLYPFILCDSLFVIQICQNPSEASISFAPIHMVPSFAPPVEHISDIISPTECYPIISDN